jgi:hypothetical protein
MQAKCSLSFDQSTTIHLTFTALRSIATYLEVHAACVVPEDEFQAQSPKALANLCATQLAENFPCVGTWQQSEKERAV